MKPVRYDIPTDQPRMKYTKGTLLGPLRVEYCLFKAEEPDVRDGE